jgi:Pyridoxamine 5'-phosphate oxidase
VHLLSVSERRRLRATATVALDPFGQIHRALLWFSGARLRPGWFVDRITGYDIERAGDPRVRLDDDEARGRLAAHVHGVLATVHAERGVDAVPVVYTCGDGVVAVPIDRVKPKTSTRLQRERNLEKDPRATLLVEHWDGDDWSRLWWVRAELLWQPDPDPALVDTMAGRLAAAHVQYRDRPFVGLLVLRLIAATGWAASD